MKVTDERSSTIKRAWDSSLRPMSSLEEKRMAWDGSAYTEREFHEWYGDHHPIIWNQSAAWGSAAKPAREAVSMLGHEFQEWYSAVIQPHNHYHYNFSRDLYGCMGSR